MPGGAGGRRAFAAAAALAAAAGAACGAAPDLSERWLAPGDAAIRALLSGPDPAARIGRLLEDALGAGADPERVGPLVRRLGDDAWEIREEASAALRALGPGAIPALRAAARSEDPEIAARAAAIASALSSCEDGARAAFERRAGNLLLALSIEDPGAAAGFVPRLWDAGLAEAAYRGLRPRREGAARILGRVAESSPRHPCLGPLGALLPERLPDRLPRASADASSVLARNPACEPLDRFDPPGDDYFFQPETDNTFVMDPGPDGAFRVEVDGNLWIDSDGAYTFLFRGARSRIAFLVRGDLYIADDVVLDRENPPAVTFLVRRRADGTGGNIVLGDPGFGTLNRIEGVFLAEGRLLDRGLAAPALSVAGLLDAREEPGARGGPPFPPLPRDRIDEALDRALLHPEARP